MTLERVIADTFGEDDLSRVVGAVRAGNADREMGRFQEAWEEWAETVSLPPLPPGHLRPFAFNSWTGYDTGGLASAWIDSVAAGDDAARLDRQILRHLLFSHSLAVPDPFFRSPDGDEVRPRWVDRDGFAAAVDTVRRYSELITRDILVIVPRQHTPWPYVTASVDAKAAELFPDPPEGWYALAQHKVVAIDLTTQVLTAPELLDPYLPTAGHLEVFRQLMTAADRDIAATVAAGTPTGAERLFPEFLRCTLPDPLDLTVSDIVNIRADGYFDRWREAVAVGTARFIDSLRLNPGWPHDGSELLDEISVSVRDAAEDVRGETGFPKNAGVEAVFNAALVGGAAAAVWFPPVGIPVAAAGALPYLANTFCKWRFGKGSFSRHVAVFSPSN